MTKILYDFAGISVSLDNINGILESINTLESSISSLSIDIPELSSSLNSAKKTTIENINSISEILTDNINKVQKLCEAYQEYESSKVAKDEFLNKKFQIKEIVPINTSYKIKYGDTLSSIAKKENVSIEQIVEANKDKIKNENLIYAGDTIIIPGAINSESEEVLPVKEKFENEVETNNNVIENSKNDNEIQKENSNNINKVDINLSKTNYNSNSNTGFNVTYNNKKYSLTANEKDLLCAIVAAECDKSPDDALAVVSTILNRCEDAAWINSHGTNPISQATAPNQYVVYQHGYYKKFTNGNAPDTVKNAVNDALNGVRNCSYLSFRSNTSTSYSNNMISNTGNRYK